MQELILLSIADVRKYRQISKQTNTDNFNGHLRSIQQTDLTDLLSDGMYYDLQSYLTTGWTAQSATSYTRNSNYMLTAVGADLSALNGQAIRLNENDFFVVTGAIYGGTDTAIYVNTYREIPSTITSLESKAETNYVNLLNGSDYTNTDGELAFYFGLRPFLSYKYLVSYITDGALKQADAGNVNFVDAVYNFADGAQLKRAKDEYLSYAMTQRNRIVRYLDENSANFPLWSNSDAGIEERRAFDFYVM